MRSVIQQSVTLHASAVALYEMYLDPAEHAAITGAPVTIAAESGANFSAFGEALSGAILALIPGQLIVQSWRSTEFHDDDADSTLILSFSDTDSGGRIDLVHLGVPDHDYAGVTEGWQKYYWSPWKAYLDARTSQSEPGMQSNHPSGRR